MYWLCTVPLVFSSLAAQDASATFPKRVLAFYYPWYGTPEVSGQSIHWGKVSPETQDIAASTHYPVGGVYDSQDPAAIDRHMRQMAEAGIDGVIVSWWGRNSFSDRAMPKILDGAAKHGRDVTVYYETIRGKEKDASKAAGELVYLIKQYSGHRAWLRVGGRPVIFLYGRVLNELRPWEQWQTVRQLVKKETRIDPFFVGDSISPEAARVFDGIHTYNPAGRFRDKGPDEIRRLNHALAALTGSIADEQHRLACFTIIPGYDDTKIRTPGLAVPRFDGKTYQYGWEATIGRRLDWVLITSWNEWHEGSELEPSVENGDRELKMTRPWVDRFKSPAARPTPLEPPPQWKPFVAKWSGGTIGLLGDARSVALDVAVTGLPYRFISLRGFCTGRVTARHCPVIIYTGGEAVRTQFGDGKTLPLALRQFARDGGVIVFASWQPWAMHRDLDSEKTAWSRTVGLPLVIGFEAPPAPGMVFRFSGHFADIGQGALPTAGDLRYRPCQPPADGQADFKPLATLFDADGKSYGPGLAAIRYTKGPFAPARMIYAWMRMWDVTDRQRLLQRVLDLAADMKRPSP